MDLLSEQPKYSDLQTTRGLCLFEKLSKVCLSGSSLYWEYNMTFYFTECGNCISLTWLSISGRKGKGGVSKSSACRSAENGGELIWERSCGCFPNGTSICEISMSQRTFKNSETKRLGLSGFLEMTKQDQHRRCKRLYQVEPLQYLSTIIPWARSYAIFINVVAIHSWGWLQVDCSRPPEIRSPGLKWRSAELPELSQTTNSAAPAEAAATSLMI